MMTAAKLDITIEVGATFSKIFIWQDVSGSPIDLTGYSARMQIRHSIDASGTVVDLDTGAKGGITITPLAGDIEVTIVNTVTTTITAVTGVYDLELIAASGAVTRLVEGIVFVTKNVTR